jgi:hypothetical protein
MFCLLVIGGYTNLHGMFSRDVLSPRGVLKTPRTNQVTVLQRKEKFKEVIRNFQTTFGGQLNKTLQKELNTITRSPTKKPTQVPILNLPSTTTPPTESSAKKIN